MAINTRRNSTNIPTVTIVDAVDRNDKIRSCCFCVPEVVGVFAILSMYFFLGIFGAAASFVSLGHANDAADKAILGFAGSLHTVVAIASALGVNAIKKEKIVLMRRLSIAFWILTILMLIFNITTLVLDFGTINADVQSCIAENSGNGDDVEGICKQLINAYLTGETIRCVVTGLFSLYFAYVIFRFAGRMKKDVLPFTISTAPVDGQKTPTYFVYSTQPPTSTNWVPPPTYTVRPTNPLPDDFNPDSKIPN